MKTTSSANRTISFGPFRLFPRQRLLLEDGKAIQVGSRALDLLIALLERPGELLSKDELISRVWPSTHVVEGNLKFQIATVRRALRDGQEGRRYLATSAGQGYRFVAEVTIEDDTTTSFALGSPSTNEHNLPARLTPLIGRDELVARLESRLPAKRMITIVGPGGIGKTSVALATAERLVGAYPDGVWSVDLTRLADPTLMPGVVAAAVRVNLDPDDPLGSLAVALCKSSMLLVLDNCAHVIDAVASLVVAITKGARGVHILATSREPLCVEGEHVFRLEPLEAPPASKHLDAAEALRFPAVQLFVDRMAASHEEFELHDEDAPLVAEICRKLDGIPLAIELAAARVDLGLRELSARLEEGLQVLKGGRRMLSRHQTMRATLDWSYDLLGPAEQTVLSRLAIFAGSFTLQAAAAVVGDADLGEEEVVDLMLELATKSLVAADGNFLQPRFRLLATTRAYAFGKARERAEFDTIAQRHAAYFLTLFESASRVDAEFDKASATLALEISNLRAALAWAFAPHGDLAVGIGLVAASVPLWVSTSMLGEWHVWAERAIDNLDEAGLRGTRPEMILRATQGMSFQLVRNSASEAHAALTRALDLAETLRDADYQVRILHNFWIYHMRMSEVRTAIALARRAGPLAASLGSPVASVTAESMLGISRHWAGEHESARRSLECLLQELTAAPRRRFVQRAGWDLYIAARYLLARIHWVQGYPDRAMNALRESIEEARRLQNPQSLCSALAFGGCALALQMGDVDTAERLAAELVGTARRHALEDFRAWGEAAQEIVALRRAHENAGHERFHLAIQRWHASGWHVLLSSCDLAAALVEAGVRVETSPIVDEELERAERDQELSVVPELLRLRGELLLLQDRPDPELARECFMRSLEHARAQGALSWELRTTMSLASLEQSQGRTSEARQLLRAVYDRFTEGFDSPDLKRAKRLLDGWNLAPALTARPPGRAASLWVGSPGD